MLSWSIILVKRAGLDLRAVSPVLSVTSHLSSAYASKSAQVFCELNCFYLLRFCMSGDNHKE